MRIAQLVAERGAGFRAVIRRVSIVVLALIASNVLIGCEPQSTYTAENNTGTGPAEVGKRPLELSSSEFAPDLVTATGIRLKTKRAVQDRRVEEGGGRCGRSLLGARFALVRSGSEPANDADVSGLIEEFPRHLAVEIANNWKVVEGPTTHRRMQAFSLDCASRGNGPRRVGRRMRFYIVVVPELNGLGPQMVNELNLWLDEKCERCHLRWIWLKRARRSLVFGSTTTICRRRPGMSVRSNSLYLM